MSTGISSGNVRSDSSAPERRIPSVSPAPIEPMRLNATVPTATDAMIPGTAAGGAPSAIPASGAIKASGNPVSSQCAAVFAASSQVSERPESAYCSSVPSWASSRKSSSSASNDDSKAAAHTTPAAIGRRRESSGLTPSGKSVVTMAKKASGCTSWLRLRKASLRSRASIRRAAVSAETLLSPPLRVRAADVSCARTRAAGSCPMAPELLNCQLHALQAICHRHRELVMHRRDRDATVLQVLVDERPHELLTLRIEVGRRLIQQPEGHAHQRECRESRPAFLSRGKRSHRTVRPSVPTDALQRLVELLLLDPASDADPIEEVLAGSQLRLQRRLMAQVGELRVVRMQILADILPAPRDLSSLRVRETTGRAQERRLARTVGAGELEALPSPDLKPYPAQHMMVAAPKVHVLALETEIGHDPWMLAKPVS